MTNIQLNKINFNAGTQLRLRGESQIHIEELAHVYIEKGCFADLPVVGYVKADNMYVPIDGFHRLMAIKWLSSDDFKKQEDAPSVDHLDLQSVCVEVRAFETLADAIIAAAGVNSTHGMKRQKGDIQNAIEAILEVDRERFMDGKYKLNKKAIMAVVNCSTRSYEVETKSIRDALTQERNLKIKQLRRDTEMTIAQIANEVNVGVRTVERLLAKENEPSKTQDAQMTGSNDGDHDGSDVEVAGADGEPSKTQDAQMTDEEEASIFAHMTSAEELENPWDDVDGEEPSKIYPNGSASLTNEEMEPNESEGITDDKLFAILASLTPAQQELARNYLDAI